MVTLFPPPSPQLPEFSSLLVRGDYHSSAPIHLLLSYASENPEARAVLITPLRESLKDDLVDMDDIWLNGEGGSGKNSEAARRTKI